MDLADKTAIVTGAGSGIGRAVAVAYAREGANVVVSDIVEKGGQETVAMIGGKAIFVRADVAKPEDHLALVKAAMDRFGALHIACNNAGISGEISPIGEHSIDAWRRVIDVNLSGVFYAMRAQIPAMLKTGSGSIVNVASILGHVGSAGSAAYTASKHGIIGLTRCAALEYAANGIRINSVSPAYIETPMLSVLTPEQRQGGMALHPIGRFGRPEEVAELVVWLSSDRASFVTGDDYLIDGGFLAR